MRLILATYLIFNYVVSCAFSFVDTCGYFPAPHAEPGNDFCTNGQFYDIAALPTSGGELFWYLDQGYTNLVGVGSFCTPLNIIGTTTYYVVAVDNGCISEPSSVNVTVYPAPIVSITPESPVSLNARGTVAFTITSDEVVTWNDTVISNSFILSEPGIYQVSALNQWGCVTNNTIEVYYSVAEETEIDTLPLAQESYSSLIYVPNSFTPNNDGINDFFLPFTAEFDSYSISIFNCWGEVVFQSNNQHEAWQGGHNYYGTSDLFTYRITANKNHQLYDKIGTILLIR